MFTPEKVMEIEHSLGADIIMCIDEPAFYPCSFEQAEKANELTLNWAKRCKGEHEEIIAKGFKHEQALFGIIQGGTYPELRKTSAESLVELDFPGYAVGGLSLGEPKSNTMEMVELSLTFIPFEKPRYLMGVGTPEDIVDSIESGIDMFDCVLPTRNARNASLFTRNGKVIIKNSEYTDDFTPVDKDCNCSTCRNYSRAYLRHLFNTGEISALRLTTIHSLYFYLELMRNAREAILSDRFVEWKMEFLEGYHSNEKVINQAKEDQTGD
jgi:queuine tRNA-ribosyltransferase